MERSMIILEAKRHFEVRAIEWWSACVMACWGFTVLLFPTLFEHNYPNFRIMLDWFPQHIWGLFALIMGLTRLGALTVNGFWYRTPAIRCVTAFLSVGVWFLIVAGLYRAGWSYTGVVIYGWHMIADIYSSCRSASDVIEAETSKRLQDQMSTGELGENVHAFRAH